MLPSNYERTLKDEIYGCFKHIGIPIETVYNMPVQDRRYYILKHNEEQERHKEERERNEKGGTMNNGDLNAFAKNEQSNAKTLRGQ